MVIEQILQDFSILFHEIINNLPSQLPDFNVPITYGIPNVTTGNCSTDVVLIYTKILMKATITKSNRKFE